MKIQNTSNTEQFVTGLPAFAPFEERDVTQQEAEMLQKNPFFEIKTSKKAKSI